MAPLAPAKSVRSKTSTADSAAATSAIESRGTVRLRCCDDRRSWHWEWFTLARLASVSSSDPVLSWPHFCARRQEASLRQRNVIKRHVLYLMYIRGTPNGHMNSYDLSFSWPSYYEAFADFRSLLNERCRLLWLRILGRRSRATIWLISRWTLLSL